MYFRVIRIFNALYICVFVCVCACVHFSKINTLYLFWKNRLIKDKNICKKYKLTRQSCSKRITLRILYNAQRITR